MICFSNSFAYSVILFYRIKIGKVRCIFVERINISIFKNNYIVVFDILVFENSFFCIVDMIITVIFFVKRKINIRYVNISSVYGSITVIIYVSLPYFPRYILLFTAH